MSRCLLMIAFSCALSSVRLLANRINSRLWFTTYAYCPDLLLVGLPRPNGVLYCVRGKFGLYRIERWLRNSLDLTDTALKSPVRLRVVSSMANLSSCRYSVKMSFRAERSTSQSSCAMKSLTAPNLRRMPSIPLMSTLMSAGISL